MVKFKHFKPVLSILALFLLVVSLAACGGKTKAAKSDRVTKAQKQAILRDAKSDMLAIEKVITTPESFKAALTGQALKDFTKQYNDDVAAGKVKIRNYQNLSFEFMDLTKGTLARVKVSFIDNSHYAKKDNFNAALTFPAGEKKDFMLHLMKVNKRWKIIAVAPAK